MVLKPVLGGGGNKTKAQQKQDLQSFINIF